MSIILILLVITYIYAQGEYECHKIFCDELQAGICIYTDSTQIIINENSCPTGQNCSFHDLEQSVTNFTRFESYNCKILNDTYTNNTTISLEDSRNPDQFICGTRYPNKNLQEGSHPKKCLNVKDCMLEDGSLTECLCSPNGNKYCKPHHYSDAYDDFWKLCEEGEMIKGYYYNWTILEKYYVYLVEHPACLTEAFLELEVAFEAAIEARDYANLSMSLVVSGFIWIVLLS